MFLTSSPRIAVNLPVISLRQGLSVFPGVPGRIRQSSRCTSAVLIGVTSIPQCCRIRTNPSPQPRGVIAGAVEGQPRLLVAFLPDVPVALEARLGGRAPGLES